MIDLGLLGIRKREEWKRSQKRVEGYGWVKEEEEESDSKRALKKR